MPWIKLEDCTGCSVCIEECPVNAICYENEKAHMITENCIRCGKCHDVCPEGAVRHDSELIPLEIEENVEKTKQLLHHFTSNKEKQEFLGRMIKYFNKEKKVAERSLERIEMMREQLVNGESTGKVT